MNIRKYIPEILTGVSIGTHVVSNVLFVRAAKKEANDGNKKHYILPVCFSAASITSIIFSNRYNAKEKGLLLGAIAASSVSNAKLVQETKEKYGDGALKVRPASVLSESDLAKIQEEVNNLDPDHNNDFSTDKEIYIIPQLLGYMPILATPDAIDFAFGKLNEEFSIEMWASTTVFLHALDSKYVDDECDAFGWKMCDEDPYSGILYISHFQNTYTLPDGTVIKALYFVYPPLMEDEWDEYYNGTLEY